MTESGSGSERVARAAEEDWTVPPSQLFEKSNAYQRKRLKASAASTSVDGTAAAASATSKENTTPASPTFLQAFDVGALLWVLAGVLVAKYFHFIEAIRYDPHVNRPAMTVSLLTLGAAAVVAFFSIALNIIVPATSSSGQRQTTRQPSTVEAAQQLMDSVAPPASTVLGIVGYTAMNVALWPVYRWLTPLQVFVVLMAVLMALGTVSPLIPSRRPQRRK